MDFDGYIAFWSCRFCSKRGMSRGAPLPAAVARMNAREHTGGLLWGASLALMTLALLLNPGGQSQPFIYFQF